MYRLSSLINALMGPALLVLLLPWSLPSNGQEIQARPLSPSVVLVLKLVSSSRAQPTTGIVLSDEGLVMVPAAFITENSEIIVLDGGTDIIKNGRPAKVVEQPPSNGWALLSVSGLDRPGITLSEHSLSPSSRLYLSAFPPAEYIAKGLPPLWSDVRLAVGDADESWSISAETPQPFVSGPIMDACGYLSGLGLAAGVQAVEPGQLATLFADDLSKLLDELQVELKTADCSQATNEMDTALDKGRSTDTTDHQQQGLSRDPGLLGPEAYNPRIPRKRLNPFQGKMSQPVDGAEPPWWQQVPLWIWLAGILVLMVLTWRGIRHFFPRSGMADHASGHEAFQAQNPEDGGMSTDSPRSAELANPGMPDLSALPPGCDAVLVVEIIEDAETRYKRYCVVDSLKIEVMLGRNECDITINHPTISAEHARITGHTGQLFLSDLGSAQGTFINGVPCLKGETFYINPGDEVFTGDAWLGFSLILNRDEVS